MTAEEEENRLKALTRRGSSKSKEKSAHSDLTQTTEGGSIFSWRWRVKLNPALTTADHCNFVKDDMRSRMPTDEHIIPITLPAA